jgi:serine protease inhibitor
MIPLSALTAAALLATAAAPPPPLPPEHPADMPAAQPMQDPARAVEASNGLGIDLYHRLAAKETGKNLFFSPYSISLALTMTAEGARGETRREMAATLHIPEAAGRPDLLAAHAGYAELARRFALGSGDTSAATQDRITKLRGKLSAANVRANSFEKDGNYAEASAAEHDAQELAEELKALLTTVDRYDLRVANALWVDKTLELVPAYPQAINQWYGTGAFVPTDFRGQPEAARLQINAWVEDHTEHRIKDLLLPGTVTPLIRMAIVNAVYFKGQWAEPFKESSTRDEDFRLASGASVKAPLMRDAARESIRYAAFNADGSAFATPRQVSRTQKDLSSFYPSDDGFTMIELPYKGGDASGGSRLAMTVLLPRKPDGLRALEAKLNAGAFDGWAKRLEEWTVDTSLPRFKMEYEQELSAHLQSMGMYLAFMEPGPGSGADFTGISPGTKPLDQLSISIVQHKAWVEVNEVGTEAAAATAVLMAGRGMAPETVPFKPVFRADHPFLFLIRDTSTGVVLFMGRVMNPAS